MAANPAEDAEWRDDALVRSRDIDPYPNPSAPPAPGRTLLPGPIASAVSFAARSTSFAFRVGTFVGGYSLVAAKATTLSSLEVGRGILEVILSRAGKDVAARSRSELGRADAETILEKSLESLHQTMSQVVFWTAASFHVTGATASSLSQISQVFLSVLDQFFGSTDSSRAIASIITLVRREFQNPATGVQGEKVGVVDLVLGLCGLAYLQNWCRKIIQDEARLLGQEEIVWDIVVLNDGERVDVREEILEQGTELGQPPTQAGDFIGAIQRHGARQDNDDDDDDDLPEARLKREILETLPKDAKVSISTSTTTTKTITVDIAGVPGMSLPSLPGLDLVERQPGDAGSVSSSEQGPNYRVVYKVSRNKVNSMPDDSDNEHEAQSVVEELDDDEPQSPSGLGPRDSNERPPPVPPKAARPTVASTAKSRDTTPGLQPSRHNRSVSNSSGSGSGSPSQLNPSTRPENAANQKKTRKPLGRPQEEPRRSQKDLSINDPQTKSPSTVQMAEQLPNKANEKKGGLRGVLSRKGSVSTFANFLNREPTSDSAPTAAGKQKSNIRPPWGSNKPQTRIPVAQSKGPLPDRSSAFAPGRETPRPPPRGNPNYFSSKDLGEASNSFGAYRSPLHQRRNSVVSLTDTFSVHSYESRPPSPALHRSDSRAFGKQPSTPQRGHMRLRSDNQSLNTPSIYTLQPGGSQASLALASIPSKGAYDDSEAVDTLRRTGMVHGIFPKFHLLRNITRYSRYASAVYGSSFLKMMGINKDLPSMHPMDETHRDIRSFVHHAELPPDSMLLTSFVDTQGGSDSTGSTETGIPLVHTIVLDEESRAVVLTCRGTLGFEDVLADMTCDYDDLVWRGKAYKVHKGIHSSARRLLYGGDGRVLATLREALEEFPDYGLVLCGHSLGGAVTALLGTMLAEPAVNSTAWVTSADQHRRQIMDGRSSGSGNVCLPAGRPIHVYAYGPPATMSPSLQKATRGLITSMVHGKDIVPYLSLGVLHDFQALALAFKSDNNDAKAEVRRRIWEGLQSGLSDRWYNNAPKHTNEEDDEWAWAALKTLRASMVGAKLLPPGEVFSIESIPVLRRDAFLKAGAGAAEQIGRPATRIVLKYIRDAEAGFREMRFGASMLMDHSPGRYEDALRRLRLGVVDA
ncbi:hypothetical protein GGR56DRAFT_465692 [Xylariaceae sp. FL0804]|nr:hypothetical protein GGR56DRAFT_465692 [Xylariaceae sp. FL0804]